MPFAAQRQRQPFLTAMGAAYFAVGAWRFGRIEYTS
jgi:hypothetical protein